VRAAASARGMVAGLALAMLAIGSGCTPRAPEPARAREIVFWTTFPQRAVAPVLARFEAANPGVHVVPVTLPAASAHDSIAAAVAAGRTPDLCQFASADLPAHLASGALSDWSAGVADLRDTLLGWPTCMVGDAIYGLPWVLHTGALFYDKALLSRAGLDASRPPETWQQLEAASARVQRLRGGVHGCGIPSGGGGGRFEMFMPLAWGDSSDVLSPAGDSTRFDCPGSVEALELLMRLRRAGVVADRARLEDEFAAGRLGFLVADGALFARLHGNAAARTGVAPLPSPSASYGHHAALASAEVLASFTTSKRKEDALRLARFLLLPDNVLALVAAVPGALPAYRGAEAWKRYQDRPGERTLVHGLEAARYAPVHHEWPAMEAAIEFELALALDGRKSAERAVTDADSTLAELASRRGN